VLTDAPDASSRSVIANADGVWFSDASIWELGLKWRKGKIAVQPRRLVDQAFAATVTHSTAFFILPLALWLSGRNEV